MVSNWAIPKSAKIKQRVKDIFFLKRPILKIKAKTFLASKVLGKHGLILGPGHPSVLADLLKTPTAYSCSNRWRSSGI